MKVVKQSDIHQRIIIRIDELRCALKGPEHSASFMERVEELLTFERSLEIRLVEHTEPEVFG